MRAGLNTAQMRKVVSITDRREAIKVAVMLSQPGDIILIAGKGHETYQEIQGVKTHFDDMEVFNETCLTLGK
jgi:UDP-N-acetylmuramoyl-L-alanyl-D-glutamate--2,6-diaminopimelate ligase